MDDDVYAEFIAEVLTGDFAAPPAGQWGAERIAAHVARNHEELIRVTESVMAEEPLPFDNRDATDNALLDRYVREYHGLRGLADRIAATAVTLRELGARLDGLAAVAVPVRLRDGDRIVLDRPMPWGEMLRLDEATHVRGHLEQLRSLRPAAAAPR
jgi:hypothetical protein